MKLTNSFFDHRYPIRPVLLRHEMQTNQEKNIAEIFVTDAKLWNNVFLDEGE